MIHALLESSHVQTLTEEELDAVTVVFHQYETGLREGTIYTKVGNLREAFKVETIKNE